MRSHGTSTAFFISPVWTALLLHGMVFKAAAEGQGGGLCPPELCGNVNIRRPFGIVPEHATVTNCGEMGFQVHCSSNIPYLGYNHQRQDHQFRIHNIFYDNASLIVEDAHKLDALNSSAADCRVPANNSSTKIASPFSISPLNQELILYNCTEAPPGNLTKEGLLRTMCYSTSFIRAGGRYDEQSGTDGSYFLKGCNATLVPVLGGFGKVNASSYLQLISDGFLLTWEPTPPPKSGKPTAGTNKSV